MEKCAQCGTEAKKHPVVAIVNTKDAKDLKSVPIRIHDSGNWAAVPICRPCHFAPTIKGHFFFRGEESIALQEADSKSLGAK